MTDRPDCRKLTLSLHPEEYESLRVVAFQRKTSMAGVARELVRELLEDGDDIRDGLKVLEDKGDTTDWETFRGRLAGQPG
ncbi:MAG: hypothetical protein HY671_03805 [Chloroflexi bacterium]|nr:hypothetical protein [Chloroflexota bacterium]